MTAEQLFAEHGIAAVPLRDIGTAAGQKNHAVVQHHFGDRECLVREVIAIIGNPALDTGPRRGARTGP